MFLIFPVLEGRLEVVCLEPILETSYRLSTALKATYGNVGGNKIFSPAAGFRPTPPPTFPQFEH